MKKSTTILTMLVLVGMLAFLNHSAFAAGSAPYPTLGAATVDGDSSEWSVGTTPDLFDNMWQAWDKDKKNAKNLSDLYLRYDCSNQILYVLVVVVDKSHSLASTDHWVKIDDSKKVDDSDAPPDAIQPDFQFLSSTDTNKPGWEASFELAKDATYDLSVHAAVNTGEPSDPQTSGTDDDGNPGTKNIPLDTSCPAAITLASFTVEPDSGTATITWETGTEIDNAGFNLYRATSPDGPWVQINSNLIPAEGDELTGASYTFVDTPGRGAYYYRLEDIDFNAVSAFHDPVLVDLGPTIRVPWYRPILDWLGF